MDGLIHDVRYTLRNMGRSPGLALVIATSLALGIGANTAIFSLIRAVLVRSLPVDRPEELVLLHWYGDSWPRGLNQSGGGGPDNPSYKAASRSLAFPFFRQIEKETSVFQAVFAFAPLGSQRQSITLSAAGGAERVDGEMVSGDFFRGLNVQPALGRAITVEDDRSAAHVAVISYGYWMRRFGGDPGILGRPITINSLPFAIVGVAPQRFFGVEPGRYPDVWVPMIGAPELVPWGFRPAGTESLLEVRSYWWSHVMARLKPDVSEQQARTAVDGIFQQYVADALPAADREHPPHIGFESGAAGLDDLRGTYQRPLYVLMGMVGLVLLIACANVAVLLLSRAVARRREFALRLSLGANRTRLIRQLLTESLLMATVGGVLGVLCAGWTSRALLLIIPEGRRPLLVSDIDLPILAFAAAVSAGTALLFGLAPAVLATRVDLLPSLKQSGSGTIASDHPAQKVWSTTFVVVQVALSLVLLVGATLFVRTLTNLQHQPLGIDDRNLLVFGIDASQNGYSGERLAALYGDLIKRLAAIPGVEGASAIRLRLFSGWVSNGPITVPGIQPKESKDIRYNVVGPNLVRTTGMQLLAGRDIDWSDVDGKRRVAVVNETMARYFFDDLNVIGKRFDFGQSPDPATEYEIIGVVSNARYNQVRGTFPRTAYIPYTAMRGTLRGLYFHVRTARDPEAIARSVRTVVQSIDPTLAIVEMDTMSSQIGESLWQERLFARLTSAFSALALTLACIGLYGTISYGVGRRRSEIAVRMALGARHAQVLWMILRQAIVLAVLGVAAGIPLALWAGRYVSTLLFGLTPHDPVTIALTGTLLIGVASVAGYLPARRATLVDTATALKQE